MAAEVGSAPVNGYGTTTYGAVEGYAPHHHGPNASTTSSSAGYTGPGAAAPVSATAQQQADLSREEVAWYFVESYYTTMSRSPEKLHLFFNKRSQLVSGVEEEKSSVAAGQKAIKERLSELDFQDCKVRVTNVDTQGSDTNIVIQVIGEMSNKSQPHRKFVQTFVLAAQTNGYFVLNDIFRYIKEDDDEEEAPATEEQQDAEEEEEAGVQEPVPTAVDNANEKDGLKSEEDVKVVDKKLEEVKLEKDESAAPPAAVNGTPVPEDADVAEAEEAPAAAISAPETSKPEEAEAEAAKEDVTLPEKPQDPAPTPASEPPAAATPSAPPKPAVPRSWAQLAAGNQAKAAAAAAAPAAARQAPAPNATSTTTTQAKPAAAATPAPASSAPAREASPDSNKEGSTGGWQTAGADHGRKQSRAHNTNAPASVGQDGRVRAFVKNVTEDVDAEALKSALSRYGEVVYFDVARQKKAAFVEYKTVAGFQAAVAASPLRVGSEDIWVEERRMPGAGFNNARGGGARGGARGAPRGGPGFGGRGGARGGSGNVTPRGGRGGAQA